MLKSYLLTALRNLRKRPFFSAINILGLAAGLAVCMLIIALARDQSGYDRITSYTYRKPVNPPGRG